MYQLGRYHRHHHEGHNLLHKHHNLLHQYIFYNEQHNLNFLYTQVLEDVFTLTVISRKEHFIGTDFT